MLKFIYGENLYNIKMQLDKIIADFLLIDPARMNLQILDGSELAINDFIQKVSSVPFLADKRLVIINNLLLDGNNSEIKNKIADYLKDIQNSHSIDIVFIEKGEPDKRSKLFKFLCKKATNIYCQNLKGAALNNWYLNEFKNRGIEISHEVLNVLIAQCGADLQKSISEIDKLSLYAKSQNRSHVKIEDVKKLVKAELAPDIFQFVSAVASKDAKLALKIWFEFLQNGESEHRILAMIVYQFRTMIMIKEAQQDGIAVNEMPKLLGLHPYVIQKTSSIVKKSNIKKLVMMFDQLRRTESAIKNGSVPSELATDILITSLCS